MNLSKIFTLLVSVGFIVPIVAVSKILIVKFGLSANLKLEPVILSVVGSLPVYLLDRVDDAEEDEVNDNKSERRELVEDNKRKILALCILSVLSYACLNLVAIELWKTLVLHVHFLIFFVYSYTKNYILLDTISVGVAWSTFIVFLVTFYTNVSFSVGMFLSMLVMKIGETEFSNIRDAEADEEAGHPTLPTQFGSKKTVIFSTLCLIVSFLILFYYITITRSLIIMVGMIPIILFYASYGRRPVEKTMYWDRVFKLIISVICLTLMTVEIETLLSSLTNH